MYLTACIWHVLCISIFCIPAFIADVSCQIHLLLMHAMNESINESINESLSESLNETTMHVIAYMHFAHMPHKDYETSSSRL